MRPDMSRGGTYRVGGKRRRPQRVGGTVPADPPRARSADGTRLNRPAPAAEPAEVPAADTESDQRSED